MIHDLESFKTITLDGRLIGLDLGTKTIGVAISDTTKLIASIHSVIIKEKQKKTFSIINQMIEDFYVSGIVLGLPLNLNGEEGPRCQSVRQFAQDFQSQSDLPICFWDERFSTNIVEKVLISADISRKKRSEKIDQMAAVYILQGALDRLRS